ncbi:DUF4365 domain-containing protein [Burkholderia cenocepacia]|uniref:DUF4365 domain-containing protein n=1 Tax=Burkholderia cepacia complex TaxID=87882 RepID=UPI001B99DD14|nr:MULTISPECIES: DUF4365 domain-containing protein [Burkholderia cepacia complex]ELW9446726.1 DUF4365 domain-containing protein [Burkholderia cenocepacia]MBR8077398.1 DUF4365 domain-containing protein [Burkholderia cenocepacia]MBR8483412.1 DUF4365 domain-containing protein [Burkholderia cenocepacia]MDN7467044.1 DUF4365 domain-containing protein [Burkholderia orbicola]MDN7505892.1 DUF4365 domain-containing protein [Burkholderia orbicola]
MIKGFPQFTPNARKGERGVDLVSRIVHEQFKWLFKRNHQEHDFGIDGHLEVVTDEGAVTGQMLAVQIKYGKSFFEEKNKWGYVYRGELKHFNYLSNYPVPTLIVICHPDEEICYWGRFVPEQAEVGEGGWKLTIPFENRLHEAKPELEAVLPPLQDSLSDLKDYWALNRLIVEAPYIHFIIDRPEVVSGDTSRPRAFFNRFRSTKELAYHCQGKVEISFHGYDQDRRELYEIKEVRDYVPVLCRALPELFFFIRTRQPTQALKALAFCQTNVRRLHGRSTRKVTKQIEVSTREIGDFLMRMWPGLNEMTNWLGMSIEENKAISFDVIRCLGFEPPPDA